MPETSLALRKLVIRPPKGWAAPNLPELWRYRDLVALLAWRDISVRYKQTLLGVAWAIIQPVATMVVFSVFFGRLAGLSSDGLPYPVFVCCALVPWQLFSYALTESSNSLVASERLITKVYFPRLIIPLSATLAGLVDFVIAFGVLLVIMAAFGLRPTANLWALPLFVILAVAAAFGVGLWLSALNVEYRDIRYTIPFLTQIWLLATPVAYSSSLVPEAWRPAYAINPMTGVVDGFRWALLGTRAPSVVALTVAVFITLTLLVSGLYYFRRMERSFADTV